MTVLEAHRTLARVVLEPYKCISLNRIFFGFRKSLTARHWRICLDKEKLSEQMLACEFLLGWYGPYVGGINDSAISLAIVLDTLEFHSV